MKVCVIGLGYIGLPTSAVLAQNGFYVHGVDINERAVEIINSGGTQIYEPDLDNLVKDVVSKGLLKAGLLPQKADCFIISVPTPFKENHEPDLTFVQAAAESIAPYIEKGNLIILESTSPVGTTEKIAEWLKEKRKDLRIPSWNKEGKEEADIYLAHCPERVLPGKILKELIDNDRVIGGINKISAEYAFDFYKNFVKGKIILTDSRTAELSKLTENSFRDVNIAFANELSLICDKLKIDVWELISLANRHPRVNILQPGPGVGGHCIAVDPWFIVNTVPQEARLIRTAREVNDYKPSFVIEKVCAQARKFKNPVIACLGLAFKADIDDLRESPAVKIVKELADKKVAHILTVEPNIREMPDKLNNLELVSLEEALEKADIILLLVDHKQFINLDKKLLAEKIVIDTRGIWR